MTDVMRRCIPVSTGALSPDLRVNYQFGLVLGVDEFEQEDLYVRNRDERAARSLHGYGTTVGLHVTAARPALAPDDVEVRVEPGIAVDQHGRPVVIPAAQCARVGAWLAAQEEEARAAEQASPLLAHLRPSGDVSLYLVVEYGSCLDALVPVPGNPCGSDDEATAASRIRDSWQLGFRWEPPPMPHWDSVRVLTDLLAPIELHDGPLVESDEPLLADHIRAMVPGATTPGIPLPAAPVLPRSGARAALDRILTIWITEVRPKLMPDLVHPTGEAAVLISTITVVPGSPFTPATPVVADFALPDDEGRPYLAPTQLVQELVAMGGGVATIFSGSPIDVPAALPLVELASLTEIGQGPARQLLLWNHLPATLVPPTAVEVRRNGSGAVPFPVASGPLAGTFVLTPPAGTLTDGELLEAALDLTGLRVRDTANAVEIPLLSWLQREGVDVLGRQGNRLLLRHTVLPTPPAPLPPASPTPLRRVRTLATAKPVLFQGEEPAVELWWHVEKGPLSDEERVEVNWDAVHVLAEIPSGASPADIPFRRIEIKANVDQLVLDRDVWRKRGQLSPYLRVVAPLDEVRLGRFGGNAVEYADDLGIFWEDAEEEGRLLVLWARMDVGSPG